MSELYHSLINESSFSSSVSLSNNQYIIFIGPNCNKENDILFESNKINTCKYQWYNFFPKILMEQFSYITNVYFLIISILQSIKEISYSNGSPIMLIPFSFIVFINGIKDIYEDWKRKKMDDLDNNRLCLVYNNIKNKFINKKWEDIKLGDILKIHKNEIIPCDMILLDSSELNGVCYVEPKNINGESNLYMKEINPYMKKKLGYYSDLNYICLTKKPNEYLYKFKATLYEIEYKMDKEGNPRMNIERNSNEFYYNEKNFILRGMILRQINYVIGSAIYIGHNTKYMISNPKTKNKKSKLEKKMNKLVIFIFCFQICLSILSSIINLCQNHKKSKFILNFIEINNNITITLNENNFLKFIKIVGTWIIIMTNFVPISLLTTFVFSKLCYGYFISKDIDMINKKDLIGAKVHSSNLNEELGQVKYIFTDKTGTLTENKMKFKSFSVGMNSYGDYDTNNFENILFNKNKKDKYGTISDVDFIDTNHKLNEDLFKKRNNIPKIMEHFFYNLCLCNDVHIENKKFGKNNIIEYIASSTDEKCLINFSRYCGYIVKNKSIDNNVVIERITDDEKEFEIMEYKICNILEFTSERKRMSVIAQKKDLNENKYILYIKGSDNIIDDLLSIESKNSKEYKYIMNKVNDYSSKGLRTLLIGYRELNLEEFNKFNEKYLLLLEDMEENNNQNEIYKLYEEIENNINLIGATAIEDKLQYKAEETINKFISIGMKICMLTGDKLETAKNIANSCKLITPDMNLINVEYNKIIDYNPIKNLKQYLTFLLKSNFNNDINKKYCLLIKGDTLSRILSSEETINIFNKIFNKCTSIICSRVNPKQKSKLLSIIKKLNKEVCLAIGDGANDVGMITEANVGIGISGKEGTEASKVSDYSLNQFYHLQKLLLYHGREAYRKNSFFILFNFYKNIIFVSPMFFYGFINFFSGITLYEPFLHQFYNVFYSIFPIFYFSIFDREYESDFLLKNPNYYIQGMKNQCFNIFIFIKYIIIGFFEGILLMISSFIFFYYNDDKGYNLNNLYSFGTVIFSGIIITVNLKVLLNSKIIDIFIITLIFLSIFSFYIGVILFSGEKIFSISLHEYFSYNYYINGDYTYIIKDNKYLLFTIFIIGLIIVFGKLLNQIIKIIFSKFQTIYYNISNNHNKKKEYKNKKNINKDSLTKENDKEDYEMQIINNSEDYE